MTKHVGLVLSKTPGYSETFLKNKIIGLQSSGIKVTLFVQKEGVDFDLCDVKVAAKVYKSYFVQSLASIVVVLRMLPDIKKVFSFLSLELRNGRSKYQSLKNLYLNSHILKVNSLDWLHFGFATMALGSEHVAKAINAKMSVSFRGFDVAIYPIRNNGCFDLLWKNVDKVHTISDDLLGIGYKLGLPEAVPVVKITPAIDTEVFKSLKTAKHTLEPVHILTVARLHWKKGLDDTLQAMAILKELGLSFKYSIVGEGSENESLHYAIHQLGLSSHVELLGKKTPQEVVSLMEDAAIYVQYSISEGFCNAVLEAQAMGCLCVVSDAEGLSENVLDGITGWVIPKLKPFLLANKLKEILDLPKEIKKKTSKQASQRVFELFNSKHQIEEFVKFYEH